MSDNNLSSIDWRQRALDHHWDIRPFIDGAYGKSGSAETFEVINPATGAVLYRASVGGAKDVAAAVLAARRAFDDGRWSALGAQSRKALVQAFVDRVAVEAESIALLDTLEMGKPISLSLFDAGTLAPMFGRFCAECVDKLQGAVANTEPTMLAFSVPEPRGVVAAIVPWNFPVVNAMIKIAPALAAGNTIVIKPSELASGSALRLAELAVAVGIPPGVLNVVPGLGTTVGRALAIHPDVDFLSFTGSTATGRKLMTLAGESNGKPLLVECGGKSPQVIFDDLDNIANVAAKVAGEALWNQGQVCVSRSRVIVHNSIKERLIEALVAEAQKLVPGDPLDPAIGFGPLASHAQWTRVSAMIGQAAREGARPIFGRDQGQAEVGCFMAPLVFDNVTPDMAIWREEVFGPVITVTGFDRPEEALKLANDTSYGLAASVWTRDMSIGLAMARAVRAGEVVVYSALDDHEGPGFSLPQEGRKSSGFGIETGIEGIKSYMTVKKIELHGAAL